MRGPAQVLTFRAPAAALLAALLGAVSGSDLVAAAGPASRSPGTLPAGPGRTLLLEACVQCHDLEPVRSQRKDAAAWRRTLNEMIWRGAPLLPGEADSLTAYLSASFGTTAPARTAATRASVPAPGGAVPVLPPGPGRELVLKACVGCHDLATSVSPRKTAAEWHRSVDLMVRLGARLSTGEITLVADYLARHRGPSAVEDAKGGGTP